MATCGVGDPSALNPDHLGTGSSFTAAATPVAHARVILFLHTLPIYVNDDFVEIAPPRANRMDQLTAAYELPLKSIFGSPLNFSGEVQTVYVHFGRPGIFEMNPRATVFRDLTPQGFQNALMELFQNNQLLEVASNEVAARRLHDINTVLAALPNNCRKVGCWSGSTSLDASTLQNFVNDTNEDESFLFVIGNFSNSEVEQHLDEFVKVSDWDLGAADCVIRVMDAIAEKWNIY